MVWFVVWVDSAAVTRSCSAIGEVRPIDNISRGDDPEHQSPTPLSPIAYSKVRVAARKWLSQIKEKESFGHDIDVASTFGEESQRKHHKSVLSKNHVM